MFKPSIAMKNSKISVSYDAAMLTNNKDVL